MQHVFDYAKLLKQIRVKCNTLEEFARAVGISPVDLTAKLNNTADFSLPEMDRVCGFLGICDDEVSDFFFSKN